MTALCVQFSTGHRICSLVCVPVLPTLRPTWYLSECYLYIHSIGNRKPTSREAGENDGGIGFAMMVRWITAPPQQGSTTEGIGALFVVRECLRPHTPRYIGHIWCDSDFRKHMEACWSSCLATRGGESVSRMTRSYFEVLDLRLSMYRVTTFFSARAHTCAGKLRRRVKLQTYWRRPTLTVLPSTPPRHDFPSYPFFVGRLRPPCRALEGTREYHAPARCFHEYAPPRIHPYLFPTGQASSCL